MQYRLSASQLDRYLARIGFSGAPRADLATLSAVHRGHAYAFTWENLDAFMGWPSSVHPDAAFDKMVGGGRGGWCYEMNGLLGAALAAIGFEVTRLCGAVQREEIGPRAVGNHLTLRIDLDAPYLADVGLGDALVEPIPLVEGAHVQGYLQFGIETTDGDWLRFRNQPAGGATTFDFRADYVDEAALAMTQAWLVSDAGSPFANNLVIQRHYPDRVEGIFNMTRRTLTADGMTETPVADMRAFATLLADVFNVEVPSVRAVWDRLMSSSSPPWIAASEAMVA